MGSTTAHPSAASVGAGESDGVARAPGVVAAIAGLVEPDLAELAELYFRHAVPEDLLTAEPEHLAAAFRSHHELAGHRVRGRAALRVFDGAAQLGRSRTVVEIVTDDMPYLVESVTAVVRDGGPFVRRIVHPLVVVRRSAAGELREVLPGADPDSPPDGARLESWMRLETDPVADADARERLAGALAAVLAAVRRVVEDAEPMHRAAREVADSLRSQPPPVSVAGAAETAEVARFVEWLADDRFTFLGYRSDNSGVTGGGGATGRGSGGLGVLRDYGSPRSDPDRPPALLTVRQSGTRNLVARPGHPDDLRFTTWNPDGSVAGEHRFLGQLGAAVGHESPLEIPLVRRRVREAIHTAGFPLTSYSGQRMLEVIAGYPREELLWADVDELRDTALSVLSLAQRRGVHLALRGDPDRRFWSCLIHLPRDRYTTSARLGMQQVLVRELRGISVDYTARVTESSVALLHVTVRTDPDDRVEPDVDRLRRELSAAVRTWWDRVLEHVEDRVELAAALRPYLDRVPAAYQEDFGPGDGARDLACVDGLGDEPAMVFYSPDGAPVEVRRFKLFLAGDEVALTELLPVLQQMGVEVVEERPYRFVRPDGRRCWIYDFGLRMDRPLVEALRSRGAESVQAGFCAAFAAAWRGDCEVDRFNALVLRAGLDWRQVVLLRAYARYLRQIGTPYGQQYLADTLISHAPVAAALVALFEARFDPAGDPGRRTELAGARLDAVTEMIDQVAGLDADRILRGYLGLVMATVRTNYYRARPHLALKIDPGRVREMPAPRPRVEIFVHSPRVEGVHLRFGPVARGGLRWSDRPADFRTEVLGLVKAQAVKNAVIVPVGAKGGFVVKRPPAPTGDPTADREATQAEGIACYRMFVSGLLDLTDNLVEGTTVAPRDVVRHDGDDSYLVVAADKGTAAFSDIANELAIQRGFWLGDAFASGGSVGYDHKAMGITAKGAWESVKRSFRELGLDTQTTEFTVVGVGDMSGDVFGNGMLLSDHIRLVAAFDHRHVFVDPDPDPARSFAERTRLFGLDRSSWDDYDRSLISPGGGVFSRTAKAVPVTEQMRTALGIDEDVTALTPPELIRAILLAPVELLWNGGVGTYVKAAGEADSEVGDKANDPVRVTGAGLRVKVIGEGGNLGLTQLGRIEFARAGGRVNTDALDNSAGVDCSDHEVNIKIPLGRAVAAGRLTEDGRRELLAEMTDEVARKVLADNRGQNTLLGVARSHAAQMLPVHARLITDLESRGQLHRGLDVLPDKAAIAALGRSDQGLTSPELATLLAHVKLDLKAAILDTELPDAAVFADRMRRYLPTPVRERFPDEVAGHPLRREIVTTSLVNDMVDHGGISFAFRLAEELAATPADAVRGYAVSVEVFGLRQLWRHIGEMLTGAGPARDTELADKLLLLSRRLLDRATRWLLTRRPQPLAVGAETSRFTASVAMLRELAPELLVGREADALAAERAGLVDAGVPDELADRCAALLYTYPALDIVEITELAERDGQEWDAREVAALYFGISDHLGVDLVLTSVSNLERGNRWHALARLALRDDLYGSLRSITLDALRESSPGDGVAHTIQQWERTNASRLRRARAALDAVGQSGRLDLATLSVVSRQLRGLSR